MPKFLTRPAAEAYGHAIGVILPDRPFPAVIGDIAHAATFEAPALYRITDGSLDSSAKVAIELAAQGVESIAGAWGTMEQQLALAGQLDVPVCFSALVQLPMIAAAIGESRVIGIISTRSEQDLRMDLQMTNFSVQRAPIVLSLERAPGFCCAYGSLGGTLAVKAVQDEVTELAARICTPNTAVGAILLDGSVLSPYSHEVRNKFDVHVFDLLTAIQCVSSATLQTQYAGLF